MTKHYTIIKKSEVLALSNLGLSIREISKKLGIPRSTIHKIVAKYKQTGKVEHLGNNGRPSNLNRSVTQAILQENEKNNNISCRKMAVKMEDVYGIKISYGSVRNYLNELDIHAFTPRKKPMLKENHVIDRFNASKRWIMMPEERVKSMIFSDESKFNLQNSDGNTKVWRKPGTGLERKNINGSLKFGGGSVMVWGCFSYYGTGELTFIDVKMDAPYYCNLLSSKLFQSASKMGLSNYIFVQDNDPKHTSKLAKEFFNENNIEVLPWPAQSPDCNPIENLWGIIKYKIGKKIFTSKKELKEEIMKQWGEITIETCQKLSLSFKKRALAVYRTKGWHIDK